MHRNFLLIYMGFFIMLLILAYYFNFVFKAISPVQTSNGDSTLTIPVVSQSSKIKTYLVGDYVVHTCRMKIDEHYYIGISGTNLEINSFVHDPECKKCKK